MRNLGLHDIMKRCSPLLAVLALTLPGQAQEPLKLLDVAYGTHERQVLDFYQAKSDKPTPVIFHVHGGGWMAGGKFMGPQPYLDKGVSVVSINYRFTQNAVEA